MKTIINVLDAAAGITLLIAGSPVLIVGGVIIYFGKGLLIDKNI